MSHPQPLADRIRQTYGPANPYESNENQYGS